MGDGNQEKTPDAEMRLTKDQIGRELLDAVMTVVEPLIADRDEITTGGIHSLADEIESGGLFCGSDDVNVALRSV